MASMDVFNDDAFSTTSLTGMVTNADYVPNLLGSLNIFEPEPVRTRNVFVDRRNGTQVLIPTSADGAAPASATSDDRSAVALRTQRLANEFTLYATEVDGIRAHGSESELEAVMTEFAIRSDRLMGDMELTHEHHRLGALQGLLLDADGTTVIYDYFSEFGETQEAVISFELDVDTTEVSTICKQVTRGMARSARGAFLPTTQVHALCGDDFYDALITHESVKETYKNWEAAADLRIAQGLTFSAFAFGGITFHNYRGTDDNSTVAIPTAEAKFFPVGARDMFKVAQSPLESIEYINTLGQEAYMMLVRDLHRDFWVKGETYSYPLYLCQQPRVLRRGTLT
ncbi:MAG: major capsid protein [Pseudomonadota bacterium]